MVSEVAGESCDTIIERIQISWVLDRYFFGKRRVELCCGDEGKVAFAYFFSGYLIDFESVDSLAVLVDELYNLFEEVLKTITLKI